MSPAAAEMRRLFLDMSPEETRRQRASELVHIANEADAASCVPLVLDRLVNFPSSHGLGIFVLHEILRLHPFALAQHIGPDQVYDLFSPHIDDREGASLLYAMLQFKESQGMPTGPECAKLQKLLMRRAKVQDLRRVPASPLRAWLGRIWNDMPSSRPDARLLSECFARWVADSHVAPFEKLPCLALAQHEFDVRGRPDADVWLVGLILEQVCRDPVGHSPDLQHLLWPLRGQPLDAAALKPLLSDMAQEQGRLVTLWICLALWAPQAAPEDAPPWPAAAPPPVHTLLLAMLFVYTQMPGADELCRTCLLVLAMISGSGGAGNEVAASAADMLLCAHTCGPALPSDVWMPTAAAIKSMLPGPSPSLQQLSADLERSFISTKENGMAHQGSHEHRRVAERSMDEGGFGGVLGFDHKSKLSGHGIDTSGPFPDHGIGASGGGQHHVQDHTRERGLAAASYEMKDVGCCYGGGHMVANFNGPTSGQNDSAGYGKQASYQFGPQHADHGLSMGAVGHRDLGQNYDSRHVVGVETHANTGLPHHPQPGFETSLHQGALHAPAIQQNTGAPMAGGPSSWEVPWAGAGAPLGPGTHTNGGQAAPSQTMGVTTPHEPIAACGSCMPYSGPQVTGGMHLNPVTQMHPGVHACNGMHPNLEVHPGAHPCNGMFPNMENAMGTGAEGGSAAPGSFAPNFPAPFGQGAAMSAGPQFGQSGSQGYPGAQLPLAEPQQMQQCGQMPLGGQPLPAATGPAPPPIMDGVPANYEPVHVGLQNTNNTCYMNTFIQGLFLTSGFLCRIFAFHLTLKKNPSKIDQEDHEFGVKLVDIMQKHMARMQVTQLKHIDIWAVLQVFPDIYRSGEQQDVTETIRFVFDKLGSFDQPLIREVFAGELSELTQCQVCKNVKTKPETFTDLVLPVPTEQQVLSSGVLPTIQGLINQRLQFEYLDDDNLLECECCQRKQRHGKWSEIVSPPMHLCLCLNRFAFDIKTMDLAKEKTPIYINPELQIGPFSYELYFVIVHSGETASKGHYYAMGRRSEVTDGNNDWVTLDDSQIKPPELSILSGKAEGKKKDDNPYVLFYRCKQAPPTPQLRVPPHLVELARQEDSKQS
eukprot:TRINITY_DN1692_c0_g1_i1.p1 TRINITY_DN1692_c0_g1~~TRINITY_DN1692_c0_g1_i1.p1  ORF type:complete len:1153 (+),score=163.20 TRINITY_DN1692_c0_g1_i1:165-3461(+)